MVGPLFGHYRILGNIGEGGMGAVYRARDERLDRIVAIKLVGKLAAEDETARARLLQEARLASALNHPHICTIYEVGEAAGQAYIAMEHVEGQPLSGTIPPGSMFVLGTVLFSGSLYLLVLTGTGWFGAITPLGGIALVAGWLALAWGILRSPSRTGERQ